MNYFLLFYLVLMVGEIILCTALKYGIFTQGVTSEFLSCLLFSLLLLDIILSYSQ